MKDTILDFQTYLKNRAAEIKAAVAVHLSDYTRDDNASLARLKHSMDLGVLNGGKRLRPFLALECATLFGGTEGDPMRLAVAMEMVHSYSLIHDDLPAMDDSDLRRGKPTLHKQFDDATAVLAGDALLTEAFVILSALETHPDAAIRSALVQQIAIAAGARGMVGGQMIDIYTDPEAMTLDRLQELHALKTGALIRAACVSGALISGASQNDIHQLTSYANNIGLAFQIVDDVLDATASTEILGKPAGLDAANTKMNFVGLVGLDRSREMAAELITQSKEALSPFGGKAIRLQQTADFILAREL